MVDAQFDALSRALSTRRTALTGLLGGLAALLGLPDPEEAGAHNYLARCRKLPSPAKRRACLRRARKHSQTHRCKPLPPADICLPLGQCRGLAVDNCGRLINCTCPAGKRCLSNQSCAQSCDIATNNCPTGCGCVTDVDTSTYCLKLSNCMQLPLGACTSTAQCPQHHFCIPTFCGPGGTTENRCVPLCPG